MIIPRRLWTACLLVVLLVGCSLFSPRYQGTLLDAATGQPISQGRVSVGEQTATTDAAGAFVLELPAGAYEAVFESEGYQSQTVSFELASGKNPAAEVRLQPRLLTGVVRAVDNSEPVKSVTLNYGETSASSAADGTFSLPVRVASDLTVSAPGIQELVVPWAQIEALFDAEGRMGAPLEVLVTPRTLQGSLSEPDGSPVADVEVRVGQALTRTDAQGKYFLRFAAVGDKVTITSPEHQAVPEVTYDGESVYDVTMVPYVAVLKISEENTGKPLPGAIVSSGTDQVAQAGADGEARVRIVPGTELLVSAFGYLTGTVTYQGETEQIQVQLTPTLLQGVIRDKDNGAPIPNALVQIFRGESATPELLRADEQGNYAIADATGVTRLYIKAAGYDRLELAISQLGQHDIELKPFAAHGIYLPFGLLSLPDRVYALLDLIAASPSLNSVVIDVKGDWALIAWPSELPVAKEIGAYVPGPMDMDEVLAAAKERGIYTIARIVTFKDRVLAQGKPEWAIHTQSGALYLDGENLPWSDPFLPEVWDYNIGIALEAIEKGFDEVQFDYLRFPSEGRVSDRVYSQEATFESRTAAMAGFCAAAYSAIEKTPAFVSADIFGLTVWVDSTRDMGIGQRLDDIAAHMDYISPMLYPQTFNPANLQFIGISDVELYPYETLYYSLRKALSRTSTKVRPWLQHYSGRYTYGLDELLRQRKGAEDGGATGWLFWNAKGSYLEELFREDPYSQMRVIPQPPPEDEE